MGALPILWIVWGGVAIVLLILLGYRGTLTRYEEDQIFLNETVTVQAQEQTDIQRKLHAIRPFLLVMVWTLGALTAVILGLFIRDMLVHLQ